MASFINTNIPSLNAQRNLNSSASSLNTSLQRLSSGMRINSAKDDAAGLGIAERMTSQIRGMNQAIRNANDGVSLSQTAEGSLATTGDMLQRIRELAVQASNATNSSSDRQAIQSEVGQLTAEINRIAQTTSFNGQNLLDGTMGTAQFQVGANAAQTITANGTNFLTNTYGNNRVANNAVQAAATGNAKASTITVAGYLGSKAITTTAYVAAAGTTTAEVTGSTAKSIAAAVNQATADTGVTATAKTSVNLGLAAETYSFSIQSDNAAAITVSFSVGGTASSATDFSAGINAINAQSAKTGVTAEFDSSAVGGIKLTNATGNNIKITNGSVVASKLNVGTYNLDGTAVAGALDTKGAATVAIANGTVTFDSQNSFAVTDAGSGFGLGAAAAATTTRGSALNSVASLDVTTFENAQLALAIVDAALSTVNGQRAQYGALQSRFESTINNLQIAAENTSSSRSRILDADFAAETANLSRATILQQAGTAMLAQANQLPQNVLTLLR